MPLDRLNAFSDGVFAIAITLLVLELTVPAKDVRLVPALLEQGAEFLGYLVSVALIGGIWLTHARLTGYMKHGDSLTLGINLLVLLVVAVLPFTTNVMVTHLDGPDVEPAVLIYGVNVLVASLLLSLLIRYVVHEPDLLVDDVADETLAALVRQRWIAIGINIVALAVALVAQLVAVGMYLLATLILLALPLLAMHRHRRQARK